MQEMASTNFETFPRFPQLAAELQDLVWEQALMDPPVPDIQRFTAEIILREQDVDASGLASAVLCFTPHEDFIRLTAGYRRLIRVCRQSKEAAKRVFRCFLPIRYAAVDATGNVMPRQGVVPFNRSGYFCISGLSRTLHDTIVMGQGARGSTLPNR